MKKKEFAVGEIIQLGLVKLKAIEGGGCINCYLRTHGICDCYTFIGDCWQISRTDKKNVIFVEVEEKYE